MYSVIHFTGRYYVKIISIHPNAGRVEVILCKYSSGYTVKTTA